MEDAAYGALISQEGEVPDFIKLSYLLRRREAYIEKAKVFVNINKAGVDFRDYPDVLKEAISIGRRIQDPLLEFSQLCGPENDILCLRYHPMQDLVGKEGFLKGRQLGVHQQGQRDWGGH